MSKEMKNLERVIAKIDQVSTKQLMVYNRLTLEKLVAGVIEMPLEKLSELRESCREAKKLGYLLRRGQLYREYPNSQTFSCCVIGSKVISEFTNAGLPIESIDQENDSNEWKIFFGDRDYESALNTFAPNTIYSGWDSLINVCGEDWDKLDLAFGVFIELNKENSKEKTDV